MNIPYNIKSTPNLLLNSIRIKTAEFIRCNIPKVIKAKSVSSEGRDSFFSPDNIPYTLTHFITMFIHNPPRHGDRFIWIFRKDRNVGKHKIIKPSTNLVLRLIYAGSREMRVKEILIFKRITKSSKGSNARIIPHIKNVWNTVHLPLATTWEGNKTSIMKIKRRIKLLR